MSKDRSGERPNDRYNDTVNFYTVVYLSLDMIKTRYDFLPPMKSYQQSMSRKISDIDFPVYLNSCMREFFIHSSFIF